MNVYLVISNYGNRMKVHSICKSIDKAAEIFKLLDSVQGDHVIKHERGSLSTKYCTLDDNHMEQFKEHMYVESRPLAE